MFIEFPVSASESPKLKIDVQHAIVHEMVDKIRMMNKNTFHWKGEEHGAMDKRIQILRKKASQKVYFFLVVDTVSDVLDDELAIKAIDDRGQVTI